jgi:hypothetical protein
MMQVFMSRSHAVLRLFRKVHLYLGVFTAPALVFFAFTGAMQSFSLHETTQGSSYKPPAWIASLAQLHKKQTTAVPVRRPRPVERPDGDAAKSKRSADAGSSAPNAGPGQVGGQAKAPDQPAQKSHLPMKIFFLIVSVGLFLSTLTGIYMAYKYSHNKWLINGLLAAGIVIPLLLLPF